MPHADIQQVHVPWSPGYQPTWSVAGVRSALNAHERGDLTSSAKLITAMFRDDRLSAVVETRIHALIGRDFRLRPADEDSPADVELAEAIEADWWGMVPEAQLAELLKWYFLAGGALGELRWDRKSDTDKWQPTLYVWDLQHLYWQESVEDGEEGFLQLQTRSGPVRITPGDGKWVILGKGLRWWENGAVRSLALPWLIRQFAIRDWARHSERLGLPIVKALVPTTAVDDDQASFFDDVRSLSNETTVILPQGVGPDGEGFDLQLLEAKGDNWEGIKALIDQMSDMFAVRMLGHNLTTEVRGGSFAASQTGNDVRQDYLRDDAQLTTTTLRDSVVEPVRHYNHANTTPDQAPWPEYDIEPESDLKLAAEGIKVFGEAMAVLDEAGFDVDNIDKLAADYGVEITKREPEPEPPPAANPFAAMPPTDDEAKDEEQLSQVSLASGDDPTNARGFIRGQLYMDSLGDFAAVAGKKALAVDLKVVLDIVQSADSYSDMRDRLRAAFPDMDPVAFASIVDKGLVLGDMAGREAVLNDL